jgi:hypothetical protein
MRCRLTRGAAYLAVAMLGYGAAVAQDADIDFTPSASMWTSPFDTRTAKQPLPFDFLSGGMPDRLMYYGGIDASHWGVGAFSGVQWSPNGLNRDGFILRMFMAESLERYTTRIVNYDTQIGRASILPGYLIKTGNLEVQVLAGLDVEADFFFANIRPYKWRVLFGTRGTVDAWWEPTQLLMLQYSLSGTTIDSGYSTRIAAGIRMFDWFWVGPEAVLSNDYFSQQTRLGGHLTGLRAGPYEWSFAGGYVRDNFERQGAYARFGLTIRPSRQPFFEN